MAARELVTRARIDALLDALGREFRHPARLFLSGGEGLVWRGLREATLDVDVTYEVDPVHHDEWIRCLVRLKERLHLSIEESNPGAFIPLPPDSEGRARHIGRFGTVDVYLFDPYAVALSKIERSHAHDVSDVRALIDARIIDAPTLQRLFEAILPRYATLRARSNPERFRRRLAAVLGDRSDDRESP